MVQRYLEGDDLLIACRAGQGAIVLVEGERDDEDAFYYNQWFGTLGREISFFPQNGWQRVIAGVEHLRRELPPRHRVFGIIDRDFAPDALLASQQAALPADGILRTRAYTLENYLLNPAGWLAVLRSLLRTGLPSGWTDEAGVAGHILMAYRACLDIAAWNRTVHSENARQAGGPSLDFKEHPDALLRAKVPPDEQLRTWGQPRGAPQPLDAVYRQHQAALQALPDADLPQWITGKAVLKVFLQALPVDKIADRHLLSIYIDKQPDPPADVAALIEQILRSR